MQVNLTRRPASELDWPSSWRAACADRKPRVRLGLSWLRAGGNR